MMFQVVLSPMIVILMTLRVSFRLLENIYRTGITFDCHLRSQNIFITQVSGVQGKANLLLKGFYKTILNLQFKETNIKIKMPNFVGLVWEECY